MKKKLEYSH